MGTAITPVWKARNAEGRIVVDEREQFQNYLRSLGDRVELTVKKPQKARRTRSILENNYYWGVVVQIISDHTGHEPDSVHGTLAAKFIPIRGVGGEVLPGKTSKLTTVQFEEYLARCRLWASEFLGICIPLPNEAEIPK